MSDLAFCVRGLSVIVFISFLVFFFHSESDVTLLSCADSPTVQISCPNCSCQKVQCPEPNCPPKGCSQTNAISTNATSNSSPDGIQIMITIDPDSRYEQTSNQLISVANLIIIARKLGVRPWLHGYWLQTVKRNLDHVHLFTKYPEIETSKEPAQSSRIFVISFQAEDVYFTFDHESSQSWKKSFHFLAPKEDNKEYPSRPLKCQQCDLWRDLDFRPQQWIREKVEKWMKNTGVGDKIRVGVHIRRLGMWCNVRFNHANTLHCGTERPQEELLKQWGHACNYTYDFVQNIVQNDFGLAKGSYALFVASDREDQYNYALWQGRDDVYSNDEFSIMEDMWMLASTDYLVFNGGSTASRSSLLWKMALQKDRFSFEHNWPRLDKTGCKKPEDLCKIFGRAR